MKLDEAVRLVGRELAIDLLCAPVTQASPVPVPELARSVEQVRAEQPRVVVRLMDSPLSPSLRASPATPTQAEVVLRDAGQVARRFIQTVAQTGGELLGIANAALLPHADRLLVETLDLLFRSVQLPNRSERQAFAPRFQTIIAEAKLAARAPLGVVLTPMLLGSKENGMRTKDLASALIRAREDVDELSSSGERKRPIVQSAEFNLWVERLVRAGTKRLETLGAPVDIGGAS